MILRIRNSYFGKSFSLIMAFTVLFTAVNPLQTYALTGGPAQPEFNSFTPIGTSDMVDLASGDFSYNIPIMDIGGFPINLAYNSGVTMDDEASWVGLGWNLSIGQINRQMRGLPDDFEGEQMQYENNVKDNYTVGTSFSANAAFFGVDGEGDLLPENLDFTVGLGVEYNSYTGMSMTPSAGLSYDVAKNASVGLNVRSTPDGLVVSPNVSLHAKYKTSHSRDNNIGASVGVSFNSRQGLSSVNMSASRSTVTKTGRKYSGVGSYRTSGSVGSSVSYVDNHYTPTVQDGITSMNFTFNASLGGELFGLEGQGQIAAYGSNQFISESDKNKTEHSYGYEYTHKGTETSVLDFNREKDGNFSVNSTNLPLTNYTYDIYAVQGQGVSGMFRPYRSQVGYVHDNETNNSGGGLSGGLELGGGNAVHLGADIEVTITHSQAGSWIDGNLSKVYFSSLPATDPNYEEVYFKNVGELSVDEDRQKYGGSAFTFGGYHPARLKIDGDEFDRTLLPEYEIKNPTNPNTFNAGTWSTVADLKREFRVRRNQAVLKVTKEEALQAESINAPFVGFEVNTSLAIGAAQTVGFIVTRNDGARYVYGKALYNTTKREVTFAIGDEVGEVNGTSGNVGNCQTGLVDYDAGIDNSLQNTRGDHYFNRVTTPAYAHTYLLTTLLSSDYSDVDPEPGPSEGDLGSYTKFSYIDKGEYHWRIPYQTNKANFNEGLKTDPTDDKGSYVYGVKEQQYIQKIETKTHVALFSISPRNDGYGVNGENGSAPNTVTGSKMYKLDKISLYSKGEYSESVATDGTITSNSVPIKSAHFEYAYDLCQGVPNNDLNNFDGNGDGINDNHGGKLTLKKVYFTYRNSKMGKYSSYDFRYGDSDHDPLTSNPERNPDYNLKGYDIWGAYKKNNATNQGCDLFDHMTAPEFNYVDQKDPNLNDNYAAWSLTDIELPSGGEIQIDYEADDYAFVQNQKPMRMFHVVGAGYSPDPTVVGSTDVIGTFDDDITQPMSAQLDNEALLYKIGSDGQQDAKFLYIKLAGPDLTSTTITEQDVYDRYLKTIVEQQNGLIQFRMLMNMTHKGGKDDNWEEGSFDYVSGYFKMVTTSEPSLVPVPITIFDIAGENYVSIPMTQVDLEGSVIPGTNVNPISKAGWHFARKYLPQYTYEYESISDDTEPNILVNTLLQAGDNLYEAFAGANGLMRGKEIARRFIPEKSWIRLMNPNGFKKGGGCRVKKLVMTDEWGAMTANENGGIPDPERDQKYGQEYTYTTEDTDGNVFSSGVATYEPVGAKDNPFCQPVYVNENRLLAPDEENYTEKPFGESFFPSPTITYSKVQVKNLERIEGTLMVKTHATGKVVTEFYTSKDYPTIVDQTSLDVREDDPGILTNLLNLNVKKHITLSQGYVVHVNDMNGKMKSQRVFGEDQTNYISGVDYIYDGFTTTDPSYPTDPFKVVSNPMGYLNNDVRVIYPDGHVDTKTLGIEFDIINDFREMKSTSEVVGVNGNLATFLVGFLPGIVPVPIPDYAHHEDKLNMSVTTKVINSYGIMREVVAHDAGASVYTRNLLWDAYTGEVLLTETVNEYGDKYYSFNYPAHWYYSGMGMASLNLGKEITFHPSGAVFELDGTQQEDLHLHDGDEIIYHDVTNSIISKAWVDEVDAISFQLIDASGTVVTLPTDDYRMKIVRSGRRNIQSSSMASVVFMKKEHADYIVNYGIDANTFDETNWDEHRIVNAGAVEFTDDWALQCECGIDNVNDIYNKYRYNTKGVWRALRSHLYLTGRHNVTSPNPRNEGFYNQFSPFYKYNGGTWSIDYTNWTFTSQVTEFNPYGFELENKDALNRYSAAQYGYNFTFPLAVGANTRYKEIGYDGFEDYSFDGCPTNEHFGFREELSVTATVTNQHSHTGKHSLVLTGGSSLTKHVSFPCP